MLVQRHNYGIFPHLREPPAQVVHAGLPRRRVLARTRGSNRLVLLLLPPRRTLLCSEIWRAVRLGRSTVALRCSHLLWWCARNRLSCSGSRSSLAVWLPPPAANLAPTPSQLGFGCGLAANSSAVFSMIVFRGGCLDGTAAGMRLLEFRWLASNDSYSL